MQQPDQSALVTRLLDESLPDVRTLVVRCPLEVLVIARDLARDRRDEKRRQTLTSAVLEKIG